MKHRSEMKIFIVGGGKIGAAIAGQLSHDGYEITVIDRDAAIVNSLSNSMDIICFQGNGASYDVLKEVSASDADIFIAISDTDEINILSCTIARMLGAKRTIARIRDVDYARQYKFYRDKLGISLVINPELATAMEIYRLLRFPIATRVEIFAKGRAELVEMPLRPDSPLSGKSLREFDQDMGMNLLICAIVREDRAFVPKGDSIIKGGDILYFTGGADEIRRAFKKLGMPVKPLQSVLIAGGGRISFYLTETLMKQGAKVTVIEKNLELATRISAEIPGVTVICDDALTYLDTMSRSDINQTDALIALSANDEYNLVAAMYGESQGINKVISRINAKSRLKVLPADSRICTISREDVAADRILGYSRSLLNAESQEAVESLYRLMDGKIEFIEFKVDASERNLGIPLRDLRLKSDILISSIIRDHKPIIPRGGTELRAGDAVLVATINRQIDRLEEIYEDDITVEMDKELYE